MKNGKYRRMYLQEFERGVRNRRKARIHIHHLRTTIKAVLDTAEDKSLGFFWLEQALKGDFER